MPLLPPGITHTIRHLSCFNAAGCLITDASTPLLQRVAMPSSCSYLYYAVLL